MGMISNSIQLVDNVTPILSRISDSICTVIETFEVLDNTSVIEPANINAVRSSLDGVVSDVAEIRGEIERVNQTPLAPHIRENTVAQNEFNKSMQNGVHAAEGLQSKIMQIGSAIGAYMGVSKIIQLSDTYSQTTARLNLMNDGLQTTAELQNKIFASAQRSRAEYQLTADFVSKVGMQARDAFSSNDEVIAMAEQINKIFKISGTSTQEQASATLQLTQALGSGVLRGEELNAVFEAAPMMIQNIADYLDMPMGAIRDMAAEGQITADIVKNAMFACADETNAKFESMPKTWSQVWTTTSNYALKAFSPVLDQINQIANADKFQSFSTGGINALVALANVATKAGNEIIFVGGAIADSWDVIGPVVTTVAAAYAWYNGVALVTKGITWAQTQWNWLLVESEAALTYAKIADAYAQYGLNAAIYACPVTWIIGAIIILVGVFYLAIGMMNQFAGTSLSATGIILGAFTVLGSVILNVIIGVLNFVIITMVTIGNCFVDFKDFLTNVFDDPLAAILVQFSNFTINILTMLQGVANAIDTIFGSNLSGIVSGWSAEIQTKTEATFGERYKRSKHFNPDDYTFDRLDYGVAYDAGYNVGSGIDSTFNGDAVNLAGTSSHPLEFSLDPAAAQNLDDTAKNTGKIKDSLDITEEDLKYLRDAAEQEIINRFTTAEVNVQMVNHNNINSDLDLDGIYSGLGERLIEEVDISAEGEHK